MNIGFEELTTGESLQIIRDIAADIWPKTFAEILSREQISYMMDMMYAPEVMSNELAGGYHFEIIKINNVPAGYFSWSPYEPAGTAKLHKLYLLQEYHGKNIGSCMLKQVEKRAYAAGFTTLRLNVNKYNKRAKKAYLRNGFTITESVKIDIGNGFFMDDFVMEKSIAAKLQLLNQA
ncbi:MAG: GNAT family N-acetyltransferase [Lentisphaerae bacterium]|nr:GNAT family N-acetyltransferase [Lentisphaerota bacterium]MBE6390507.1 GNAT family N-acetyltransferase [Lentisphaerota bacterium]